MINLRINRTIYPSLWRTIKQLILSPKAYHMPSLLMIEYLLEFQRTNSQSLHQHSYADVRCIVLYIYSSHILLLKKSDCKVTLFSRILQAKLRKRPNRSKKSVRSVCENHFSPPISTLITLGMYILIPQYTPTHTITHANGAVR